MTDISQEQIIRDLQERIYELEEQLENLRSEATARSVIAAYAISEAAKLRERIRELEEAKP